jgi:hypothetical protein
MIVEVEQRGLIARTPEAACGLRVLAPYAHYRVTPLLRLKPMRRGTMTRLVEFKPSYDQEFREVLEGRVNRLR